MKIGVVGAGTMGSGIAQVVAFHGHQVYLCDSEPSSLKRAVLHIEKSLGRIVKKMDTPDQMRVDWDAKAGLVSMSIQAEKGSEQRVKTVGILC